VKLGLTERICAPSPPRALAKWRNRRVGFIFQAYHLLPELSALENVALPARLARIAPAEAARRATALLERVGLGQRLEHRPYELSGGEQQRVAIARALVNEPDLILADEPTGNLDSHTGGEIIQLLEALRAERQATFIMATHDAHIAARAQRVIELADGQLARLRHRAQRHSHSEGKDRRSPACPLNSFWAIFWRMPSWGLTTGFSSIRSFAPSIRRGALTT
jgi:ABC-type lipoprotein export system ATPase subunit